MDVAALLSDRTAMQQLVDDLYRPFESEQVAQVVALRVASPPASDGFDRFSTNRKTRLADFARTTGYSLTTAIAGAVAGAKQIAYGEVWAQREERRRQKETEEEQKMGETRTLEGAEFAAQTTSAAPECLVADEESGEWSVELERELFTKPAKRVLLVVDSVGEVESILAARDALSRLGCDVVGVSFVVATTANVLHSLASAHVTYCCLWDSSRGVKVKPSLLSAVDFSNGLDSSGASNGARKRQRIAGSSTDLSVQVVLSHCTAEYQANSPSEDRSVHVVKTMDASVQIYAVFDGHGGSRAVDHLRSSLCQDILGDITSNSSSDEVRTIVESAFARADEELKQSLLALAPDIRLSKGYCNAGSCAVIALFVHKALYVANVGDCAAVLGKMNKETKELQAIEVSTDHSCSNSHETKLVIERSHDRNAIRMSKDDVIAGLGTLGAQRVAGSLAMTRAFGDFYLKCPELSMAPFKSKVPYITSQPSISTVDMDGSEKYVILASDGLWDVMTPQEAVLIVDKFDPEQSLFYTTASAALIHAALEKIAHRDGLLMHELMSMSQGSVRRSFHDDITCTVVYIDHQNCAQQLRTADLDTNGMTPDI
ncbi:unnamed protein product [Hyaloperonospora brassicae]|uniref:PPM-type phosphatase domain-containing protein n=1 Tax=Hyaloperonospora brassicae TaxID=162125 RepID=A0AAV0T479_HYABA|nr:unnamed protein product [Hyaloperonospora brassicae]